MIKTAAGLVNVLETAKSDLRGGATMFFGTMEDGRFVVTSRFQYEIRTRDRTKAEAKFKELCNG